MNKNGEKEGKRSKGQSKKVNKGTKVNKAKGNDNKLLPADDASTTGGGGGGTEAEDISSQFPNFSLLNEEERQVFFQALTNARKNVEKKGIPTRQRFGTVHDEYLKYFLLDDYKQGEPPEEGATPPKTNSTPIELDDIVSLSVGSTISVDKTSINLTESNNSPTLLLEGSSEHPSKTPTSMEVIKDKPEILEECESVIQQDTDKVLNLYLKKKKKNEGKPEPEPKKPETPVKTGKKDVVPDKKKKETWAFPMTPDKPPKAKETPRFDELSAEEREVFFSTLQEARNNILGKNPDRKSEILPMDAIVKRYKTTDRPVTSVYTAQEATKRLQTQEGKKSVRVKVTLTSGDNERMRRTKSEDDLEKDRRCSESSQDLDLMETDQQEIETKNRQPVEAEKQQQPPQKPQQKQQQQQQCQEANENLSEDSFCVEGVDSQSPTNLKSSQNVKRSLKKCENPSPTDVKSSKKKGINVKLTQKTSPCLSDVKRTGEEVQKQSCLTRKTSSKIRKPSTVRKWKKAVDEDKPTEDKKKTHGKMQPEECEEESDSEMSLQRPCVDCRKSEQKTMEEHPKDGRRSDRSEERCPREGRKFEVSIYERPKEGRHSDMSIEEYLKGGRELERSLERRTECRRSDVSAEEDCRECKKSEISLEISSKDWKKSDMSMEDHCRELKKSEMSPERFDKEGRKSEVSLERESSRCERSQERCPLKDCTKCGMSEETCSKDCTKCDKSVDECPVVNWKKLGRLQGRGPKDCRCSEISGESCPLKDWNKYDKSVDECPVINWKKLGRLPGRGPKDSRSCEMSEESCPPKDCRKSAMSPERCSKDCRKPEMSPERCSKERGKREMSPEECHQRTSEVRDQRQEVPGDMCGVSRETLPGCCSQGNSGTFQEIPWPERNTSDCSLPQNCSCEMQVGSAVVVEKTEKPEVEKSRELVEPEGVAEMVEVPEVPPREQRFTTVRSMQLEDGGEGVGVQERRREEGEEGKGWDWDEKEEKEEEEEEWEEKEEEEREGGKVGRVDEFGGVSKTAKVMIVDDNVIEKIRKLIFYLEAKAGKDDRLEKEYMKLLVDYVEYLSKVLETLVRKKDRRKQKQVHRTYHADVYTGLEEMKEMPGNVPRSVSAQVLGNQNFRERKKEKTKVPEKEQEGMSVSAFSDSDSSLQSEVELSYVPPSPSKKKLVSTKIRLLQDLLKQRAEFVVGSMGDLKIVQHEEDTYVPPERPPVVKLITEEEGENTAKVRSMKLIKIFVKCISCGRKKEEEDGIFENLRGEAVRVDVCEGGSKDPTNATLNRSIMEVLKASGRKRIIEKYYANT